MKYSVKHYPHLKEQVEAMDAESLLRLVICPDTRADRPLPNPTSSVFIHPTTKEEALNASLRINGNNPRPALIVSDMEYGAGNVIKGATVFPSMRAVAETGDSKLAYEMGVIAAKEAMAAGYHWTFGPSVDILGTPYSPVTFYRTPGSDPEKVIEFGGAYMSGLQDTGLIATLKHFPGDGYCVDDQHVTTPENPLSCEEWDKTYGRIYSELIEQGAMAVMPGHIALPCYDEADENGIYPPATLSKKLLTGLLREKLGFEGIIVSDAVNMNGFCGYINLYHAASLFLESGGDCLLFMKESDEFFEEMKRCISEGRLSMETLRNRAYRMLCFANEYFENHSMENRLELDASRAEGIAKEITFKGAKIRRNRRDMLPYDINSETRIAHVIVYNVWTEDFSPAERLTAKLSEIAGRVEEIRDPGPGELFRMARSGDFDLIICSVFETPSWAINTCKLSGPAARNMMGGWMRFQTPAVFISYNSPAFAETYKASVDTLIETHGIAKYTAEAVMKLLCK